MRRPHITLLLVVLALPLLGQPRRRPPSERFPYAAEIAVKSAAEQLATSKKAFEIDIDVLRKLRAADVALTDPMQPRAAIESAFENVRRTEDRSSDFLVRNGVTRIRQQIEAARRSPGSADFGRLRAILRDEALGPASRVAVRNAKTLQEETLAWINVQLLVSNHLHTLTELSNESLQAAEQE